MTDKGSVFYLTEYGLRLVIDSKSNQKHYFRKNVFIIPYVIRRKFQFYKLEILDTATFNLHINK